MTRVDRRTMGLLLAAGAAFFLLMIWIVLPAAPAGFDWDDTWYIWMAEWFSGRQDYLDVILPMLQARQYPPFFPFMLSMAGDVLESTSNGLILNAVFLATGTLLVMTTLTREGMPAIAAVFGGFLMMFNPIALTYVPALMSEPLFILITVIAIGLASASRETFTAWFITGLLAGLCVATRSIGWALVAALLVQILLQAKPRRLLYFLPGLGFGLLFIFYLKAGLPGAHNYLQGFYENLSNINLQFLVNQAGAIVFGWQQLWGSVPGAILAAIVVLPGMGLRLVQAKADAWYILISLVILMVWPFPDHMGRFLWVLFPMFLMAAQATLSLPGVVKQRKAISVFTLGLLLLISIPDGMGKAFDRLLDPPGTELNYLSRHSSWTRPDDRDEALINLKVRKQFLDDMEQIKAVDTGGFCVHSELPALVSVQARKVAYASPWNSLENISPAGLNCRYYYLVPPAFQGVSGVEVDRFTAMHQELFRSFAPYDESGETILGVFLFLFPAQAEIPGQPRPATGPR